MPTNRNRHPAALVKKGDKAAAGAAIEADIDGAYRVLLKLLA